MAKLVALKNVDTMQRILDEMIDEFGDADVGEVIYPVNDKDSKYKVTLTIQLRATPSVSSVVEFGDVLNYHLIYEDEDHG
tara:strand:+ start:1131 stop:1370 length:240 start_codon:yes stop_codon:yes gene_type:complete